MGRRLTKTVNGVTTKFIYAGNQVIEEITNGVTKHYLVGLGLDDVWASRQGSVDEFLLKDVLNGSVMAVVDPTSQTVKTGYGYSPFGTTFKSNNNSNNNLLFTGRELDLGGSVYYFRARYYNTGFQRFLSEDPIGFAGGDSNLYRYGRNNPLVGNDPTGLCGAESNCGGDGGGGFNPFGFVGLILGFIFGGAGTPSGNPSMGPMNTGGPRDHGVLAAQLVERLPELAEDLIPYIVTGLGALGSIFRANQTPDQTPSDQPLQDQSAETPQPKITKRYKRPSRAVTRAQQRSVQGKKCVTCGEETGKRVADHKVPLVQEYYETGKIDKEKMVDLKSVQPQCVLCSNKQGRSLQEYSRVMRKKFGL